MKTTTIELPNSARQSLWMLLAAFLFALSAYCVKQASDLNSSWEIVFYRSFGGLLFILIFARVKNISLHTNKLRAHLLRGVVGVIAMTLFYFSLAQLPVATAFTLNYTSPIFFVILTIVVWREPLSMLLATTLIGGFSGMLLLLQPTVETGLLLISLVGLLSGVFGGLAYFCIRWLGVLGENTIQTVFYFTLCGVVTSCLAIFVTGNSITIPQDRDSILAILGLVVLGTSGQLVAARALHRGRNGTVAVFAYSGVLFTMLIDLLIFNINFTVMDYLGIILIVVSGSLALLITNRQNKTKQPAIVQ